MSQEKIIYQQDKFANFSAYRNVFILWGVITAIMPMFVNWQEYLIPILAVPFVGLLLFIVNIFKDRRIKYIITDEGVKLVGGRHTEFIPFKNIVEVTKDIRGNYDLDLVHFMPYYYGGDFKYLIYKTKGEWNGIKIFPSPEFLKVLKKYVKVS
jgi:hypothetical protein